MATLSAVSSVGVPCPCMVCVYPRSEWNKIKLEERRAQIDGSGGNVGWEVVPTLVHSIQGENERKPAIFLVPKTTASYTLRTYTSLSASRVFAEEPKPCIPREPTERTMNALARIVQVRIVLDTIDRREASQPRRCVYAMLELQEVVSSAAASIWPCKSVCEHLHAYKRTEFVSVTLCTRTTLHRKCVHFAQKDKHRMGDTAVAAMSWRGRCRVCIVANWIY